MNWTIRTRLFAGFGLLILACITLGGASVFGFNRSGEATNELAEMSEDLAVGAKSMEAMLLVRMHVKDFLLSNSEDDIRKYTDRVQTLREAMHAADQSFQNPTRRELIAGISERFERYDTTFTRVQAVISTRNEHIEAMLDIGKTAREQFSDLMRQAAAANDIATLRLAATAQEQLMLARLYALNFSQTSSPAAADDFDRWASELQTTLASAPATGPLARDFSDARDRAVRFKEEFAKVRTLVDERNELVLRTLDVIGPEILELSTQVQASLIEDTARVRDEAAAAISRMRALTLTVGAIAVTLGIAAALVLARSIVGSITLVVDRLREIADGDGDLTVRLRDTGKDEFAELGRCFNRFVGKLAEVIGNAKAVSLAVASASQQVAASAQQIAANLERQEASAVQISSAAEEMSHTVSDVARNAAEASEASANNKASATKGGEIVDSTTAEMDAIATEIQGTAAIVTSLGQRGDQIGEIIEVINDIAEQTNLLALNAAIEAARAGEHGRGFAVVADEVRKLAERTTSATQQVAQSIGEIQSETRTAVDRIESGSARAAQGVTLASDAGKSLRAIVDSSESLRSMVTSIAAATEEQSATSEEIARVITEMSEMSRETSAGARQSSEAAALLSEQAERLQATVARFKLE
jgi:methyl-accepting chemotaxis protein